MLQLVEQSAKQFVCIVDESKLVSGLGGSKGGALPASTPKAEINCWAMLGQCFSMHV